MSYTNQESYDTTRNTVNPLGSTKPATGGGHFGDSGNPNTFSDTGNTHSAGKQPLDNFNSGNQTSTTGHFGDSGNPNTFSNVSNTLGSNTQSPGNYGSGNQDQNSSDMTAGRGYGAGGNDGTGGGTMGTRGNIDSSAIDTNNMGVGGLSGAGNRQAKHVSSSGAYGAEDNNNNTDSNAIDDSGNTMVGAGEGFAAGTTNFANDRQGETEREQRAYGNYSATDANAPPPGFRGGANDPAYQPGQHYDYKAGGIVPDEPGRSGNKEHHHHHRENDEVSRESNFNNNNSTSRSNDGNFQESNFGSTGGDNLQSGATGLSRSEQAAIAGGLGGGALYAEERKHRAADGGETGFASTDNDSSMINTGAPQNSDTNSNAYTDTASAIPNAENTPRVTGTHRVNDNLADTTNIGSARNTNTEMAAGGGKGWKSGMTGLTEDEIRTVTEGRHAPGAVEAHPNPSEMESYGQNNTNTNY
ncbi:hypothetical protein FRB98_000165 [Tulasnella sp. 332]|nr:hypothetical protein FRB98_000165 [Tulasnella sp. 332]